MNWLEKHPNVAHFSLHQEDSIKHYHHINGKRAWGKDDYQKMSLMRNYLLDQASVLGPDHYFSLDSDILLDDPNTLIKLQHYAYNGAAVSPLLYMRHYGCDYPSIMSWYNGQIGGRGFREVKNYPIGHVFQADIIMAAVMMSKPVYKIARYFQHPQGEDLGWSASCAKNGFKLYAASDIYCPHIMHESSTSMNGPKGPGILDVYLAGGDDRRFVTVN